MYINLKIFRDSNVSLESLFFLIGINQKDKKIQEDYCNLNELDDPTTELEVNNEFVYYIKTGKTDAEKVRITKSGKEFLAKLNLYEDSKGALALTDEVVEAFEAYDKEYGNKTALKKNIGWYLSNATFDKDEVMEALHNYLAEYGSTKYCKWAEYLFWDKKRASVFTTMSSRTLDQSPLYEYMRRISGRSW
jgi:hypothetical protein|tara:strand:- start:1245 stop:1817 length:573 start_codon:yes stop_codon:yes gene_type:complete